jgi:hypothetical protein
MRLLQFVLLGAILQLAQNEVGAIEGIVTQSGTNFPIAGVQVELRTIRNGQTQPGWIETTTDGAGAFAFRELSAGSYALEFISADYIFEDGPTFNASVTSRVVVNPGQRTRVPVNGIRGATISGQILDADGHGLPDVPVEILQAGRNAQGERIWRGIVGPRVRTDDRGEYRRTLLGPGQYVVRMNLERPNTPDRPIYAPGTADANAAMLIGLREGSEVTADIRVVPSVDASTYKISGKVTSTGKEAVSMILRRRPAETDPLFALEGSPRTFTETDVRTGKYEFRNTVAGVYELYATASVDGKEYLSKTVIEVRDMDLEDVDLVLHPTVDIKGRLVVDGDPRDIQIRGSAAAGESRDPNRSHIGDVGISLRRTDGLFSNSMFRTEIGDDGVSFTFRDVPEGDYDLTVNFLADGKPPSPDLYVADIRAGGRRVIDTGFQVGVDAVDAMEVVIGTEGGSVKGNVLGRSPNASAIVVLAPATIRDEIVSYRGVPIARNGSDQFEFRGVRPGSYLVFAVQANADFIRSTNNGSGGGPEMVVNLRSQFFSQNEARGARVTVMRGNTTSGVQVPLIPLR